MYCTTVLVCIMNAELILFDENITIYYENNLKLYVCSKHSNTVRV